MTVLGVFQGLGFVDLDLVGVRRAIGVWNELKKPKGEELQDVGKEDMENYISSPLGIVLNSPDTDMFEII